MRGDAEWGGQPELMALSWSRTLNVMVHQLSQPSYLVECGQATAPVIHLSYHDGNHYNSVHPDVTAAAMTLSLLQGGTSGAGRSAATTATTATTGAGSVTKGAPAGTDEAMVMASTGLEDMSRIKAVLDDMGGDVTAAVQFIDVELQAEVLLGLGLILTVSAIDMRECDQPHADVAVKWRVFLGRTCLGGASMLIQGANCGVLATIKIKIKIGLQAEAAILIAATQDESAPDAAMMMAMMASESAEVFEAAAPAPENDGEGGAAAGEAVAGDGAEAHGHAAAAEKQQDGEDGEGGEGGPEYTAPGATSGRATEKRMTKRDKKKKKREQKRTQQASRGASVRQLGHWFTPIAQLPAAPRTPRSMRCPRGWLVGWLVGWLPWLPHADWCLRSDDMPDHVLQTLAEAEAAPDDKDGNPGWDVLRV